MKRLSRMTATAICFLVLLSGCGTADVSPRPSPPLESSMTTAEPSAALGQVAPTLEISKITTLEPGFSSASFSGKAFCQGGI